MIKVSLVDVERVFRDFYNLTHFKAQVKKIELSSNALR